MMNDERFFVYSRDHSKPIRVMTEADGGLLRYMNIRVISWDADTVTYLPNTKRAVKALTIPRERILSAAYARGDDGESDLLKGYDADEK